MNRHALTYIEMYPAPITTAEPSGFVILLSAVLALGAVYLLTVFLFCL